MELGSVQRGPARPPCGQGGEAARRPVSVEPALAGRRVIPHARPPRNLGRECRRSAGGNHPAAAATTPDPRTTPRTTPAAAGTPDTAASARTARQARRGVTWRETTSQDAPGAPISTRASLTYPPIPALWPDMGATAPPPASAGFPHPSPAARGPAHLGSKPCHNAHNARDGVGESVWVPAPHRPCRRYRGADLFPSPRRRHHPPHGRRRPERWRKGYGGVNRCGARACDRRAATNEHGREPNPFVRSTKPCAGKARPRTRSASGC
jgi:hypothetical protein